VYEALLPKFQALSPNEVAIVNLDIPAAVTMVLGAASQIATLKDQFEKDLPTFDAESVMQLESYALALSHAHTLYSMASQPADSLAPLVDEGTKLRSTLLADATALVQRNLLSAEQLRDLNGPVGYKNLAFDLQILAELFRSNMDHVAGKCATQPAEIQRADEIAERVLRTVGVREQEPAVVAASTDVRARAFTVFTNVYDQARRAVSYLRWNENDADSIAPSLYAGRGNGRKKDPVPAPGPTPPAPPAPTPTPVPPIVTPTNGQTAPVAAGLPGAHPFAA
jgi:hypothetical protein